MNTSRGAALLALVAGILVAGGCQSQSSKPAAKPAADKPAKAVAKKDDGGAKKSGAAATAKPAAAKPAAAKPGSSSGANMDDLIAKKSVREQKRQMLVSHYLEVGEKAYAASDFDGARAAYGNVLDLEAGNESAHRRLQQIGAILGDRGVTGSEVLTRERENRQVRMEQAALEVSSLAGQAAQKAELGDHDGAVTLYERALVIVRLPWGPQASFTPSEDGLHDLLASTRKDAREAGERTRRTQLKEAAEQARAEAAAERMARRSRLQTLFRQANTAMETSNFQTAQNLAEEILRSSPENKDARRLRDLAVNARFAERDESQQKALTDEWKHVFHALEDAATPQSADYTFPDSWETLQAKRSPTSLRTSAKFEEDPRDRESRNLLQAARTTVNFEEASLDEAVEYLARISGTNIVVLPDAREGKSEDELQVDLKIENAIAVDAILDLITRVNELAWNIDNGVVQITTPEAARGPSFVQLYDVKDLATEIKNFPGDDINLDPSGEYVPEEEVAEPQAEFVIDSIQELIQTNVDPEVWDDAGSVEVLPPGTLIVKAPGETHAKVQQLLDGLRGAGGLQVSIETRFIRVADNFLQDVGVDLRGLGDQSGGVGVRGQGGINGGTGTTIPVTFDDVFFGSAGTPAGVGTGNDLGLFYDLNSDGDIRARFENLFDTALGKAGTLTNLGGLSFSGTLIDDTQLEVILRAVEKTDRSTMVIAPRLTAYNGQRANVTVLNQLSYIADFDVEIAQASQIGDPIVQTLRDGVVLDLRPTVSADRRFITMELRPTIAIVTRPIATFQTTLANGPPVTIQLPELQIQRVRTTVTMPDGGTLLLGGLKFFEERRLESTVPWLGDIPVASFFVSHKGVFLERRNLLVLIRARILRPEEDEPGTAVGR